MITINQQPDPFIPVFQNSIPFRVTSNFNTVDNFRYVFSVRTGEATADTFRTKIVTYPRTDGSCIYSPHLVLKSNVDYNVTPGIITFTPATQSFVFYDVAFGEKYNPDVTFIDTSSFGGFLQLTIPNTPAPGLIPGDQIRIDKFDKSVNIQYDTVANITSFFPFGPNIFYLTDVPFGVTVPNEGGKIIDVERIVATSSVKNAFNGAKQYDEPDYHIDFLRVSGVSGRTASFMSVYGDYMDVMENGTGGDSDPTIISKDVYHKDGEYTTYETLSFMVDRSVITNHTSFRWVCEAYSATGSFIDDEVINFGTTSSNTTLRWDVPAGPGNISLIDDSVAYYDIYLQGLLSPSPNFEWTFRRRFYIKRHCREYPLINLAFVNKWGGVDYWTFEMVSKYRSRVEREMIKKVLRYDYEVGERQNKVISHLITEQWTINTDWLSDQDALFVRELVESPEVYWYAPDEFGGFKMLPIIITSNEYEFMSTLNDEQIKYSLTFAKAYDIISNI